MNVKQTRFGEAKKGFKQLLEVKIDDPGKSLGNST